MTKLPASSVSPTVFLIGTDSPVSKDSLTSTSPFSISPSVGTWFPKPNTTTSSKTISSGKISIICEFLRTFVVLLVNNDSLSIHFFALISCMTPIKLFET